MLRGSSFSRYYFDVNHQGRNRPAEHLAAAGRAHHRATGGAGMGDIAIFILMRSCNVLMAERLGRLLEPHGLPPLGYITMMALHSRAGNLTNPSELSDATGETRGNMTRICDDLVDKGLMRRVPNAEDRRRVDLSLTDTGTTLLDTLAPPLRRDANDFYRRSFSSTEKATLQQLLTQFSTALASEP
jgi:MarR family transcriptional repressor of emrRAB